MASIFSKIGEVFKKRNSTPAAQETPQTQTASAGSSTSTTPAASAFKPSATMTVQKGSSGKKETVDVGFKPTSYKEFSPSTAKETEKYTFDRRSLSDRSRANDAANGIDWSGASREQLRFNDTYYKTLDDPAHTKMYRDLETASRYGKDATKEYRANRDALDDELDRIAKEKGKGSDEYRALQKFVDDYTELGRQMVSTSTTKAAQKMSQQMDDMIQDVFAGYIADPSYQEKVAKGKQEILGNPKKYGTFTLGMRGASEQQKDLLYAVFAEEGEEGAKDFYERFLSPTVSRVGGMQEFAKGVSSDSKFERFLNTAGGAIGGAMAGDPVLNGGIKRGVDALTGKSDPLDSDVLVGDYTVSDAMDSYLKKEFSGVDQEQLDTYGKPGFEQLGQKEGIGSWYDEAKEKATDYEKQLLGLVYLASEEDEDVAKDFWRSLQGRAAAIQSTVNGGNFDTATGDAVTSQLYQNYLDQSKIAQMLYKTAVTTGSMGTQRALAIINPILSGVTLGFGVFGNAYNEARAEGKARGQSLGYAASEGFVEGALETLVGSVSNLAGFSVDGAIENAFLKRIASPYLRAAIRLPLNFTEEGTEEYLENYADVLLRNLWFSEKNKFEPLSQENLDTFLYAGLSSLILGGGEEVRQIKTDLNFADIGKALNDQGSVDKLVDTILNNPIEGGKKDPGVRLYKEAKELAQKIKDGKLKANDINVGETFSTYNAALGQALARYVEAGGDASFLTNPDTVAYNKETLTPDDLRAGATSMLVDLGGDVELADAIVKAATNQTLTQEQLEAIQNDQAAVQVLSQLLGDLDMTQDTALTRAARSTTMKSTTGNKVYDVLKTENTSKTVATPVSQRLYDAGGMSWSEAEQISGVIEKVMNGTAITEDEAELITVSNAAVRSMLQDVVGVELDEDATIGRIMDTLNDVAANMASVKEMQSDIRQNAEQVAKARMPIPPAQTRSTITLGDSEYSHDEFVEDYMNQHGVSQAVAEQAWQQRATVDAALSGEEESNGTRTIPGNPEGRHVDLAAGGQVRGVQERDAGSGRAPVARGAESSGREDSLGTRTNSTPIQGAEAEEVIAKLNAKQRDFVKECKDDGFESVTLVKGPLLYAKADGTKVEVNALVNSKGDLVIRWDNPRVSPYKVANHERIHRWLSQFTDAERAKYVSDALFEIFGEGSEEFAAIYDIYAKKYGSAYGDLSGLAFQNAVFEEIFADLYAGMDLYNAGTAQFQQQAEMYVENTNLRGQFFGEESTSETNYGESFERFNLADPFRESTDWDIPSDVRPFPGEEPMHEQMDRFSVSSMAEGSNFDLLFNESGQPYALVNKGTGERVTEVTADMMIGTPLGDIVQMAVDNGNITEDEAKVQRQMLADAMNLIVKYNDAAVVWELAGSQLFSAIKSNSDKQYNKTIDFSTICKKTMAIVDAMSETMKRLGRGLTRREVEAVYLETGKAGEATPCPVCYVFSRWMGIGNLLDQMSKFQDKYAGKSEEELVSFMQDIEDRARAYAAAASKSKQEDFYDKNGNLKIGKVISDMKSKPNSKAASAIKKLNQHQQANDAITELTRNLPNATPEQAARWRNLIKVLKRNVLKDSQIAELQEQMEQADAEAEVFEVYQWLAKTVLMSDASRVNEDGEAIGSWKKNPNFKPVPKDILFDLNRGGDFAKDYPLSWAFRTGKGCAMGKAITPYADARVGETIQGVAMDVKNIRVGADINEFLNGDVKKQQKTLESARKKQKQQNLIGGMRYQSTSDFRYEFGSDYLMTFFEMQALGANVQLYTKVIEAVDFLASTGADCNLSVMPLGDGYVIDPKTGKKKLAFSNVTGINAEAAIKKAKQYDNVQLILVGINDENIRLALEGTDVTFVIPFHGSGQSVHQVQTLMDLLGEHLDVTQAQDYTSVQSDHVSPKQTAEQKAMWDLRVDIITGKCADGLTTEQQTLLAKNQHLQKLYNMFYVDETAPAYQNFLGKDQAEQIFPYEYWNREGDYEHADENGRTFQEYCKSMGIIPRFSGINSKGERVGFGDFTKDKGYWKLLIDRSMYENVYDENGEWIGYGKYRDQQKINMSNVKLSDLDPETGKAQFTKDEMSKQYDATHSEEDRQNLDTIVTNSIQRIEAMRDKGDVFDKTQVNKGFRTNIMKANAEIRGMDNDESIVRASVADNTDLTEAQQADDTAPVAQQYSSEDTSINNNKLPSVFSNKWFTDQLEPGGVNIDIGGGKYDNATEYLSREYDVTNMVFDPFNRDREHNSKVLDFITSGNEADTATCANVLNVINEAAARENVILECAKAIKPDGKAFFLIYEGDGTGNGRTTRTPVRNRDGTIAKDENGKTLYSTSWQEHRKAGTYVDEIKKYFDTVKPHGNLIEASDPKANLPKAAWGVTPGEAVRFSAADDQDTSTNPYKEGSFESMAFDLIKKAQNPDEFQNWINDLRQKQADAKEAGQLKAPVIPSADKATPVNKTQQKIRENQLAKLLEKYGAFKQGEKAARNQPIPEKISDDRRVRRYVRTAAEAEATPQRLAERIGGETLVNELLSYTPITDSDAMAGANHEFNRLGYKKALKEWQGKSSTDHFPTKNDIAFGSKLLVEAMRNGDDAVAMQTLADLAAMETQAGQVAQAARLLKQLGPSGQLYYVQKAVDRLNHQNEGRIAKGTMDPIIIDQDLAKAVMLAETQEEMDEAMEALKQDIADKLPVTLKDRWDAWRYLAMLGNPRTHVRNYLGNLVFSPVRFTKDLLAAAGEKMFIQDESQRTKDAKALMKDPRYNEIRQFAEEDFEVMQDDLTGNGKMNPLNEIMGMRKVLPGILDKASQLNDSLLTKEDVIFLRKAYVSALTQFIAARGLSLEDLSSGSFESNKLMNEARRYAALEAQKATYRDFSRVAAALNSLRRAAPGLSPLLDGLMPFTKTPINILKRGLEYSPAGLAKALVDLKTKVKKGDMTAAEAIDHAAAGLTGTGVALLGWLLASLGMARGGADDDDKKDKLEKAQGHQDYSLEIGGKSYTIDWMAPVALPFFVGVEAYNQLTGEGQASFMDFVNALTLIAEPMMSLSMLDGINSTLSAVRSGSNSPIQSVASNILASYISQGAPTLLGQIARTIDPDRRSTYVDKNSENPAFMQRFVQNLQGKVPVLSSQKMAYVDTWGRKDTNESIILRGLENFISPGYANRVNETPVDTELLRLAEATGNNKVLPSEAAKYFQVEGETLNLNAKQYEQYKTTTGQTAFKLLGNLFADPVYAAMDDAQKANAVEQAMKIATAIGKQDVAPTYKTDGWIQRAIDHDNLETASMFHMLKNAETGLSNYQLISAMDWLNDEEKGELVMQEHPNTYRQMTDYTRKGYKFTLTDENIAREREIYESLFWPAYNELISSSKFRKASVAKQADMLSKMQSTLGTEARKRLGKELRSAGIKSHKPSDADVPDNVTNLYDLLNRP